jgi:hypothetical protein
MRENRPYGSEGGESGSTGLPYPYPWGSSNSIRLNQKLFAGGLLFLGRWKWSMLRCQVGD